MVPLDEAYAETKRLMIASIGGADWERPVPATPDWQVRDVVAHVTGLAAAGAEGRLPADVNLLEQFRDDAVVEARDAFADGQVLQRQGQTPHQVLAEWAAVEPGLLEALRSGTLPMGMDIVLVTDLCVHSDDVALALGRAPHRDTGASRIALSGYRFGVDYRLRALELPALALRYDGKERVLGEGAPAASVTAERWELLRVLAGRRSRAQILALDWDGDPSPYLGLLPAYGERADDLVEA